MSYESKVISNLLLNRYRRLSYVFRGIRLFLLSELLFFESVLIVGTGHDMSRATRNRGVVLKRSVELSALVRSVPVMLFLLDSATQLCVLRGDSQPTRYFYHYALTSEGSQHFPFPYCCGHDTKTSVSMVSKVSRHYFTDSMVYSSDRRACSLFATQIFRVSYLS